MYYYMYKVLLLNVLSFTVTCIKFYCYMYKVLLLNV